MEENNNFDLEKLNSRYVVLKNKMTKTRETINNLEDERKQLESRLKVLDGALELEKQQKNVAGQKNVEQLIKDDEKRLKEIKEEVTLLQEDLTGLKEKIDKTLDKVKENPELKKHIEEVAAKRYDRQNKKIAKEIKAKEEEKGKEEKKLKAIEKISELVKNHPTLNNNLKGVLQNKAEIKKLQAEKDQLMAKSNRTPADNVRMAAINQEISDKQQKADKNKGLMMDYIKKNKLEITEKDIDGLADYATIGKDGQVNVGKALSTAMKASKQNIEKLDKEITRQNKKIDKNRQAIINLGQRPTERENPVNTSRRDNSSERDSSGERETSGEEKPKWWQFKTRFQRWNEKRKQKALEAGRENAASNLDTKRGDFADSLKYEVVQKAVNRESKEAAREAQRQNDEQTR